MRSLTHLLHWTSLGPRPYLGLKACRQHEAQTLLYPLLLPVLGHCPFRTVFLQQGSGARSTSLGDFSGSCRLGAEVECGLHPFCEVASPLTALLKAQPLESQAAPPPHPFQWPEAPSPADVSPSSLDGKSKVTGWARPLNLSTGWPPLLISHLPSACSPTGALRFPQPWGQGVGVGPSLLSSPGG